MGRFALGQVEADRVDGDAGPPGALQGVLEAEAAGAVEAVGEQEHRPLPRRPPKVVQGEDQAVVERGLLVRDQSGKTLFEDIEVTREPHGHPRRSD